MQEVKDSKSRSKKKNKKKKVSFLYLYLFAFVFLIALAGFSYLVKSYSPDIDVTIGNNDSLTLSESDMDIDIKSVDERLKWIQMEDEMPTVAIRNPENQEKPMNLDFQHSIEDDLTQSYESKKVIPSPPTPTIKDIQVTRPDFRTIANNVTKTPAVSKGPIPLPSKPVSSAPVPSSTITKVYLGKYSSIDEATAVQQSINSRDPSIQPFVKSMDGQYIVQLGSFSDKEKAVSLVLKLRDIGYFPKILTTN